MFPLCLRKLTSAAQKEVDRPWRLSTWADVSHMPGLERGGAENVCRVGGGGNEKASAPRAPIYSCSA